MCIDAGRKGRVASDPFGEDLFSSHLAGNSLTDIKGELLLNEARSSKAQGVGVYCCTV